VPSLKTKVVTVRVNVAEYERWLARAEPNFNKWANLALRKRFELEESQRALAERESARDEQAEGRPSSSPARDSRSARACSCPGIRGGSWCKSCGRVK
jgi:hypothetical protein